SDTGYQLVPPSRSSISRENDTSQVQNPIGAVAGTIVSAADELMEGLGDLITPSAHGDDYAETAWQRKLRNQANRKKKRGRGL
ncbi:MAG: mobilization protein, partial [Prevotella pallens]|nr:mobilization protein [Prevotella pallens]